MSLDEASRRELIEIWLAANDGAASEKDLQRLNAALVEDAEFRNHLLQIIEQQAWLTKENQPSGANPRFE